MFNILKFIFKFVALVIAVIIVERASINAKKSAEIVRYEFQNFPDKAYHYVYETSDGQFKEESGFFRLIGGIPVLTISGSYGYIGDDGKTYKVQYTSDEKGFRASEDRLPNVNTDIDNKATTPQQFPTDNPPESYDDPLPPKVITTLVGRG